MCPPFVKPHEWSLVAFKFGYDHPDEPSPYSKESPSYAALDTGRQVRLHRDSFQGSGVV